MSPGHITIIDNQSRYLDKFLKSRKSKDTKRYVKIILDYLTEKMDVVPQGWVRSRDLATDLVSPENIPNTSNFYKLLSDLEEAHLIVRKTGKKEKPGPGSLPVYYRTQYDYNTPFFLSKEELIQLVNLEFQTNMKHTKEYEEACNIFYKETKKELDPLVQSSLEEKDKTIGNDAVIVQALVKERLRILRKQVTKSLS